MQNVSFIFGEKTLGLFGQSNISYHHSLSSTLMLLYAPGKKIYIKIKPIINFFKDFIYLFLEREWREKEGKKHHCVVAS